MKIFHKHQGKKFFHFLFLILFFSSFSLCQGEKKGTVDIHAFLSAEKAATGEAVQFEIQIKTSGDADIKKPALPREISGFQIIGTSISTQMTYGPGGKQIISRYILTLLPLTPGTYTLPPVQIEADGKKYFTEKLSIVITKGNKQNIPEKKQNRIPDERGKPSRPDDDGTFI